MQGFQWNTHTFIGSIYASWWNWTTEGESTTVFFITSSYRPHTLLCKSAGQTYSSINLMPFYLLVPDSELKQRLHCIEEHKNKTELQNFNRTRVWNRSYMFYRGRDSLFVLLWKKQIDDTDWRPLPVVQKYDTLSLQIARLLDLNLFLQVI